jgi:hypothetical protein
MIHRGAPPFTKPTRFQLGSWLVSTCTALPVAEGLPRDGQPAQARAARDEPHVLVIVQRAHLGERGSNLQTGSARRCSPSLRMPFYAAHEGSI